jgi:hypothetical protein
MPIDVDSLLPMCNPTREKPFQYGTAEVVGRRPTDGDGSDGKHSGYR